MEDLEKGGVMLRHCNSMDGVMSYQEKKYWRTTRFTGKDCRFVLGCTSLSEIHGSRAQADWSRRYKYESHLSTGGN